MKIENVRGGSPQAGLPGPRTLGVLGLPWGLGPQGQAATQTPRPHSLVFLWSLQLTLHFPEEGLVFDYRLEDAGISSSNDDEDEDEEGKQVNSGLCRGGKPGRALWVMVVLIDE